MSSAFAARLCPPSLSAALPSPPHARHAATAARPVPAPSSPRAPRPRRSPPAPADAPDIGCPFTCGRLPSHGLAPPRPAPPRAVHARSALDNHTARWGGLPGMSLFRPKFGPGAPPGGPGRAPPPGPVRLVERGSAQGGARLPLRPADVPAAEAVVRGDGRCRVELTTSTTSPTSVRSKNQPAGVSALPPFTSRSPTQPWLTLLVAEDVRGGPVVAVQEGARLSVSRIACGTSLMSYSPPKPTVLPFIRVTSCSSRDDHLPVVRGGLRGARGDRHRR